MKQFVLVLCALGALATSAMADTQSSIAPTMPTAILSKPYAATLGDMIALTMTQYAQVQKSREGWNGMDSPVIATYDHDSNKLVLSIFGYVGEHPVDQARTTLDSFRGRFVPLMSWAVGRAYHVSLDENDLTIVFYNRATMKEVLRRQEAKYLVGE